MASPSAVEKQAAKQAMDVGIMFYTQQAYEFALAQFEESTKLDATQPLTWCYRGHCYLEQGDYQNAIGDYTKALEINNSLVAAVEGRAKAHSRRKDYELAAKDWRLAATLHTESEKQRTCQASASYQLGHKLYLSKQLEEASVEYSNAIRLNPKEEAYWSYRGYCFHALKKYSDAISDYTESLELCPTDPLVMESRAMAHKELGDRASAARDYSAAAKLHANTKNKEAEQNCLASAANCSAGQLFEEKDDPKAALEQATLAVQGNPKKAVFWFNRANCHLRLGDHTSTISDINQALSLSPKESVDPDFLVTRGFAHAAMRDWTNAVRDLREATGLFPVGDKQTETRLMLGCYLLSECQFPLALVEFNKVVEAKSKEARYFCQRGYCHHQLGDYKKANTDFARSVQLDADDPAAFNCRANTSIMEQNWGAAVTDLQRVASIMKESADASSKLKTLITALQLLSAGDYSAAVKALESTATPLSTPVSSPLMSASSTRSQVFPSPSTSSTFSTASFSPSQGGGRSIDVSAPATPVSSSPSNSLPLSSSVSFSVFSPAFPLGLCYLRAMAQLHLQQPRLALRELAAIVNPMDSECLHFTYHQLRADGLAQLRQFGDAEAEYAKAAQAAYLESDKRRFQSLEREMHDNVQPSSPAASFATLALSSPKPTDTKK